MAAQDSWVNGLRANALAKIYLTRSDNVEVLPVSRYATRPSYDLLVRIDHRTGTGRPEFGVRTKGTRQPLGDKRWQRMIHDAMPEVEQSDLPVCLFVFNVETEEGFYGWLKEPVIDEVNGRGPSATLGSPGPAMGGANGTGVIASFARLDDEAVKQIMDRVVRWYQVKERDRSAAPVSA